MCGVRKYLDNRLFLEYGDAQNLENCVKAQVQIQPLPDDGYQDVDRDGDPHLRLHGILRGPEECLDPKMLLDPPEEELDLPALLVQQGDAFRGKGKIVGEEDQVLPGFRVDKPDATQFVGVTLRRVDPREDDGLVGPYPGRFVDGCGIQPAIAKILLRPDDEEGRAVRESMKPFEVQIPPVHHVVRSRLGDQFVQDVDVVPLPVGDLDERGDVPPKIQQGVEFDGRLPFPELRPRKERETQVDRRGVEGVYRLLQLDRERIVRIQLQCSCRPDQSLCEVGEDAPVAVLVGLRQGGSGDPAPDAHVVELPPDGPQVGCDVPQAFAKRQLGEGHTEELVETGEFLDLVFPAVSVDALSEFANRKELDQLREDGSAGVHRPSLRNRNGHRIQAN